MSTHLNDLLAKLAALPDVDLNEYREDIARAFVEDDLAERLANGEIVMWTDPDGQQCCRKVRPS